MGGEGDDRGWDGWMASPTQCTWVWVNSGSWWWTGRPGVLQSMVSKRVGHNWAIELTWSLANICHHSSFFLVMRLFKIYSLSNFQIYNIINYGHHAICYIPRTYFRITGLYFLTPFTYFTYPLPLATANLFSVWVQCWGLSFVLLIYIPHEREIRQNLSFSDLST